MRHRRHSYASEMIRSGVGLPVVMKLLGHTSADMTMRYIEVALSDLRHEFGRIVQRGWIDIQRPKKPPGEKHNRITRRAGCQVLQLAD